MELSKILSNRRNQYIIGGIAILGVGYYLYKKGKLPFSNKGYKMGYLQQGKLEGKDNDKAVAVHFANPRPKESIVAPNGKTLQTSDYVYISKTGVFDGKYKLRKKWIDTSGNLGAVWIGVTKKLGAQSPAKITDFEGKGRIEVKSN
jgi:hypothetical protein